MTIKETDLSIIFKCTVILTNYLVSDKYQNNLLSTKVKKKHFIKHTMPITIVFSKNQNKCKMCTLKTTNIAERSERKEIYYVHKLENSIF